jgi:HAMP domain-containing protein
MSLTLAIRLVLAGLLGTLLVVTLGAALQLRELAVLAEGITSGEQGMDAVDAVDAVETLRSEAITSAVGLGILGALVLVLGAWVSRSARLRIFERLARIDDVAAAIQAGDVTRRVGDRGADELARVAAAVDAVLDLRDRDDAAARGRNRELRAVLVAVLRQWPHPVAIAGIDGEIIVSTLSPAEDEAFGSITPELRKAARTLLSRGFSSAAELATDIRTDSRHWVRVRALTIGEDRMVGWLVRVEAEAATDASE